MQMFAPTEKVGFLKGTGFSPSVTVAESERLQPLRAAMLIGIKPQETRYIK
jgi:hypothetical protein